MEEITIKVGGTYDIRERRHQVLILEKRPLIFSHDRDIKKAWKDAVDYIEHNLIK